MIIDVQNGQPIILRRFGRSVGRPKQVCTLIPRTRPLLDVISKHALLGPGMPHHMVQAGRLLVGITKL